MILLIVIQIITIQKINDYIELFCLIKKLVINKYRGSYMAKQYSIELIALGWRCIFNEEKKWKMSTHLIY